MRHDFPTQASAAFDSKMVSAMDEIHDRMMSDATFNIEKYVARFPDHAEALRKYAATMKAIADFGDAEGHSARPKTAPASPAKQVGEFSIVREIGRGGMGIVYEALQGTLDRRVALKILPYAALIDDRQLKRFQNEARAAATLHHPNIVPIHSVGTDKGIHFYAMQLIDGPSVAKVIRGLRGEQGGGRPGKTNPTTASNVALSAADRGEPELADTHRELQAAISTARSTSKRDFFRTVAKWITQAAEALAHAHENGVLHRDIKPGNLLIDRRGDLWVTDFGLARLESDASMTATGDLRRLCRVGLGRARGRSGSGSRARGLGLGVGLGVRPVFRVFWRLAGGR